MTDEKLIFALRKCWEPHPELQLAADRIEALTAENERFLSVLTEWEEWEGKLLMDNRAWADGDGCHIPQDLFDEYVIGPQQRRDLALVALEKQP